MRQPIKHMHLTKGQPCKAKEIHDEADESYLEPHRHEYWEILWCMDDSGSQSVDFVDYDNKAGRFFTIAPGQVHNSAFMGKDVRLLVFAPGFLVSNSRSAQLVEKVFATHDSRLPYLDSLEQGKAYLEPTFQMIRDECEREDPDWDLVESLSHSFLRYLLRFSVSSQTKGEERDNRVIRLMALIEDNYKEHKKCQFYADSLALTNKRLNELTKAERGKTVTQLIHDRVLLEANRELVFSSKTIKTIAFDLGFDDPSYFSRFYRGQMKETPAEFRERCSDSAIQ